MDEIELLSRGEIYIRILSCTNAGPNPIPLQTYTYRLLADVQLTVTRSPRLTSTRSDPRYLSRSPGLYGFPTTSAEIDFLPAVGQHRAFFFFFSFSSPDDNFETTRNEKNKRKEAYSVMPSAQMSVPMSVSSRDYSRTPPVFRISLAWQSYRKTDRRGGEQLTDDSISLFSLAVLIVMKPRQAYGNNDREVISSVDGRKRGDGIKLKQEHRRLLPAHK